MILAEVVIPVDVYFVNPIEMRSEIIRSRPDLGILGGTTIVWAPKGRCTKVVFLMNSLPMANEITL